MILTANSRAEYSYCLNKITNLGEARHHSLIQELFLFSLIDVMSREHWLRTG